MKRTNTPVQGAFLRKTVLIFSWLLSASVMSARAEWKPVSGGMLTRWGRELDPSKVWQEYPRPQMQRENWTNLNGLWDYAITEREAKAPSAWDGVILVPFAPEAQLSGVGRLLEPNQALWYRRNIPGGAKGRTLLHFEAVDYQCTVWMNGKEVGNHTGGHTPFSFDISGALKSGDNELLVRVFDATEGFQLHGKQKLQQGGIWYTRVSGIWQTVWLEQVPERFIRDLDYASDITSGTLTVKVVGEFGGHGWPVDGHLWKKDNANWGYGGLPKSLDEWKSRYERSISVLAVLRKRGISAGVYTQTSDVEVEINGLLTYDREQKVDPAWLRGQSKRLLETPDVVRSQVMLPSSEAQHQTWRYATETPPADWQSPAFDDRSWREGPGGFGSRNVAKARVGTEWNGREIWMRREFQLAGGAKGNPVIRVFHDEDAEIYLNGTKVADLRGFVETYIDVPLTDVSLLKAGRNVIAIHCRQSEGGQFIDAGIVDETPQ